MTDLLLVDPQLGEYGLGALGLQNALTLPAVTVKTAMAVPQAMAALREIRESSRLAPTVVGRAAGCNVVARLLSDGLVDRVLLIDPIATSTEDEGLHAANRADSRQPDPEQLKGLQRNPEFDAILSDLAIAAGTLPDNAYELLARGMSNRPSVQEKLACALREVEKPRQPYDDRKWLTDVPTADKLDWLADLANVPAGTATVWLSQRNQNPLGNTHDYLLQRLPNVQVEMQPWDEYDFIDDPRELKAAISQWRQSA